MPGPTHDLLAIGNALVDVLAHVDDAFIAEQDRLHGMKKGSMTLIDQARAASLYAAMPPAVEVSGGSAGNTMAGFASFGGRGAYIGKVADDQLGRVFSHDMKAQGVTFGTAPLASGAETGRCLVLVTSDGQRTMNTFLGAAVELSEADVDPSLIAGSAVTYLEGYLFDPPGAKRAFRAASRIAHEAGRKVALSLSDSFCVDRHRDDFLDLLAGGVDILFANEDEAKSLFRVPSIEEALPLLAGRCEVAVLTRGASGSLVVGKDRMVEIAAEKTVLVDTTGAGDQYAAGFLYGYTQGRSLDVCGRLGALAAAEVIAHVGPRPETPYESLLARAA